MGKKHFWVSSYDRNGDVIEITIKDNMGSKIETWAFNIEDKKTGNKVMKLLRDKYNFYPEIPTKSEESVFKKEKDLKWLE